MNFGYMGIASSLTSAISGYGASISQASGYNVQAIQSSTQAYIANLNAETAKAVGKARTELVKLQGKADSLALSRQFNQTMASNAVMAAAQGRSGGSVQATARATENQYNWDRDFTKMSSDIQAYGYQAQSIAKQSAYEMEALGFEAQSSQYSLASSSARSGAFGNAISTLGMNMSKSLYSIGN